MSWTRVLKASIKFKDSELGLNLEFSSKEEAQKYIKMEK